mgnify:CR=1 FL=1
MTNSNKRKPLKGPSDVGVIKRKAMSTNTYTMDQNAWQKKYPGFSYTKFKK